jgi:hypothetical protein
MMGSALYKAKHQGRNPVEPIGERLTVKFMANTTGVPTFAIRSFFRL